MPQIISETAVRQAAEEIAQENTVFRDAFRSIDVPERTGDTFSIPVPDDVLGEAKVLQPGSEFDYGREEYTPIEIVRGYYGSGSRITEQAQDDASFNLIEDHVERHAQKMAEKLDAEAYATLDDAAPIGEAVSKSGGADDELTFDDIMAGVEELEGREGGYQPDMAFVGTSGKNDILRDLAERGTDLGDEVTERGQFTRYAGIDFMFSNTGDLTSSEAILIDSDYFGYEGVWTGVSTDSEDDFDTRSTKLQIFAEMGWAATQPESAVRVEG